MEKVPKNNKKYRTKVLKDSAKMVFSVVPQNKKSKVKKVTNYDFKLLSNKGE